MPELDLPDLVLLILAAGVRGVAASLLEPDGVTDNLCNVRFGGSTVGLVVSRSVLLRSLFPVLEDPIRLGQPLRIIISLRTDGTRGVTPLGSTSTFGSLERLQEWLQT